MEMFAVTFYAAGPRYLCTSARLSGVAVQVTCHPQEARGSARRGAPGRLAGAREAVENGPGGCAVLASA